MNLADPVAQAFSAAAASYDGEAALQRSVGHELLRRLPGHFAVRHWLDLGCGTGYFCRQLDLRFPAAQGLALDLAPGMLQQARVLRPGPLHLCGDAQALPLASDSLDLVFSSLALQWCGDFSAVLAEVRRVLRPGGLLVFSSLAQGTLQELADSWLAGSGRRGVNAFRSFAAYQQLCADSGLVVQQLQCELQLQHYADVRRVLQHLKGIGAHHSQHEQAGGLLGRTAWQQIQQAYERQRQPQGLPVSWQVVTGVLRKPGQPSLPEARSSGHHPT